MNDNTSCHSDVYLSCCCSEISSRRTKISVMQTKAEITFIDKEGVLKRLNELEDEIKKLQESVSPKEMRLVSFGEERSSPRSENVVLEETKLQQRPNQNLHQELEHFLSE